MIPGTGKNVRHVQYDQSRNEHSGDVRVREPAEVPGRKLLTSGVGVDNSVHMSVMRPNALKRISNLQISEETSS